MTKKILIVDDEKDICAVLRVSLEKFALWQAIVATSGKEAILKAKLESPDAILLDVSMPDMDGFQVWEKLQADAATQLIPVILVTAKVLSKDRKHFSTMGVAGVITKPFNPVKIWEEIVRIISEHDLKKQENL
ncbi:response regulator [Anabaenopsis sp. FSS-46]|uniref:response regulator n=1 Tax=Anabaenopsis sp. FSS-46 TaxID=2971766 RepID=UPI0024747A0C|nr:response regulator [Anabaenopsis sp. FSS-46]MDH6098219.1 response regulator [Anabaenopsis sp. FSS-46]